MSLVDVVCYRRQLFRPRGLADLYETLASVDDGFALVTWDRDVPHSLSPVYRVCLYDRSLPWLRSVFHSVIVFWSPHDHVSDYLVDYGYVEDERRWECLDPYHWRHGQSL